MTAQTPRDGVSSYYDVLGVEYDASADSIKRAWRTQVKQAKQARASETADTISTAEYERLLDAGEVLNNLEKRRVYNHLGHDTFVANCGRRGNDIDDSLQTLLGSGQPDNTRTTTVQHTESPPDTDTTPPTATTDTEQQSPRTATDGNGNPNTHDQSTPHKRYNDGARTTRQAAYAVRITPPALVRKLVAAFPTTTRLLVTVGLLSIVVGHGVVTGGITTGVGFIWLLVLTAGIIGVTGSGKRYILYAHSLSTPDNTSAHAQTQRHTARAKTVSQTPSSQTLVWLVVLGFLGSIASSNAAHAPFAQTITQATTITARALAFAGACTVVAGSAIATAVFVFGYRVLPRPVSSRRGAVTTSCVTGLSSIVWALTPLVPGKTVLLPEQSVTKTVWGQYADVALAGGVIDVPLAAVLVCSLTLTGGVIIGVVGSVPVVMAKSHEHVVNNHYIRPVIWEVLVALPAITFAWSVYIAGRTPTTTITNTSIVTVTETTQLVAFFVLATAFVLFAVRSQIEPQYSRWREDQVSDEYSLRR